VHLVQNMNATAVMVGIVTMVSSLTSLPGMRLFGQLSDRIGPRRVQLMTGLLIPLLPVAWIFITASLAGHGRQCIWGIPVGRIQPGFVQQPAAADPR
jgi:MFS family permease